MSRAHPTGTKQHQNESYLSNRREDPKHQENKVIWSSRNLNTFRRAEWLLNEFPLIKKWAIINERNNIVQNFVKDALYPKHYTMTQADGRSILIINHRIEQNKTEMHCRVWIRSSLFLKDLAIHSRMKIVTKPSSYS